MYFIEYEIVKGGENGFSNHDKKKNVISSNYKTRTPATKVLSSYLTEYEIVKNGKNGFSTHKQRITGTDYKTRTPE